MGEPIVANPNEVRERAEQPEWHVTLEIDIAEMSESDLKKLSQAEMLLSEIGIHFDTGSGFGKRDWELDWSLKGATTKVHRASECHPREWSE